MEDRPNGIGLGASKQVCVRTKRDIAMVLDKEKKNNALHQFEAMVSGSRRTGGEGR